MVHLLLDPGDDSLATRSRFVRSVARPGAGDLTFDPWMDWCYRSAPPGSVLIPCADRGLEFISRHRALLQAAGLRPAPGVDEILLALLDKERTYEMAREVGMAVPRTERVTGVAQACRLARTFELPFALKPRVSHLFAPHSDGHKAVVIRSYQDLEKPVRRFVEAGLAMILTEIVPGPEENYCSYYTYLDEDGRPLAEFTKRKLRQYPVGFGEGTYHVTDWAPDVAEAGLRLFSRLGLQGMGNVEFKRDQRDGRLTLIECNARLTAANELVRRAGVDFAEIIYQRAIGAHVSRRVGSYTENLGLWFPMHDLLAFAAMRSEGKTSTSRWLSSIARRHVSPVLDCRDLGPTLTKGGHLVKWASRRATATLRDRMSR